MPDQVTHTCPSGAVMDSRKDGFVCITDSRGEQIVTSAVELAYILQRYQEQWGGIPIQLKLTKDWKAIMGEVR